MHFTKNFIYCEFHIGFQAFSISLAEMGKNVFYKVLKLFAQDVFVYSLPFLYAEYSSKEILKFNLSEIIFN